jgi:undecaprenyl-diphosphatase
LNYLDFHIITFLNQFAQRSSTFDSFVALLSQNYLLKTGVLTAMLGWAWFLKAPNSDDYRYRPTILCGLIASGMAVLIARIISLLAPFRERPMRSPFLDFVVPHGVNPNGALGWSAFPSDNATLFFGLAACLYLVSRRAGLAAFCHVALVVGFGRVYVGYHHPSDILAGAVLGIGAVSLTAFPTLRTAVIALPLRWLQLNPASFHAAFFLFVFLIGTTFEPLYPLAFLTLGTVKAAMHLLPHALTAGIYR